MAIADIAVAIFKTVELSGQFDPWTGKPRRGLEAIPGAARNGKAAQIMEIEEFRGPHRAPEHDAAAGGQQNAARRIGFD